MQSGAQTVPVLKGRLWAGRILSAIPVLMLLFAGIIKLIKSVSVVQGLAQYGYPESLVVVIGILELACTVIYLIPRSSLLGAILLTAFLGGATATNVRVKDPSFVLPVVFGVLVWAGLFLREERLWALILMRRQPAPHLET